eukprot:scaffold1638_cov120-Cylindrotheca_fusiformis.AAC.8
MASQGQRILTLFVAVFLFVVDGFQKTCLSDSRPQSDCHSYRGLLDHGFKDTVNTGQEIGSPEDAHFVFPGGGIMFYWQAGVITYLREQGYDLSSCTFAGASAGALTATLTTADVEFYEATELALKLAADAGVWDRSGGLQSIWGPMIEQWLDTLLPESIESVEGRLSILGKSEKGHSQREVLVFDWTKDKVTGSKSGLDIVEALSPEGIYGLLEQGKSYAKAMEEVGKFSSMKKAT